MAAVVAAFNAPMPPSVVTSAITPIVVNVPAVVPPSVVPSVQVPGMAAGDEGSDDDDMPSLSSDDGIGGRVRRWVANADAQAGYASEYDPLTYEDPNDILYDSDGHEDFRPPGRFARDYLCDSP